MFRYAFSSFHKLPILFSDVSKSQWTVIFIPIFREHKHESTIVFLFQGLFNSGTH